MKVIKMDPYVTAGVNYRILDAFKRECQRESAKTPNRFDCYGFSEVSWSQGESAHLVEYGDHYLGHTIESLGTKNIVADEMYRLTGKSYDFAVGYDGVASIVNDLITLGVDPLHVSMHIASGDLEWFRSEGRRRAFIKGWVAACLKSGVRWSHGETGVLKDVICPGTAAVSGSGWGVIKPKSRAIYPRVTQGTKVLLLKSTGIHMNGLTLARSIASKLHDGYLTKLSCGRTFGEALLEPTQLYVRFLMQCLDEGVEVRYAVHITGHGWRKLLRFPGRFVCAVEAPRELPPLFRFMQESGNMSDRDLFGILNAGAGFAVFIPAREEGNIERIAMKHGIGILCQGSVFERKNEKKLQIIIPDGKRGLRQVNFGPGSLRLSARSK